MARPAPSVERVISVLNFFAEHGDEGFTLTDVIRSLRLNRATCHSLLNTLAEAGYLYRNSAKEYRLGPALAAIGRIADQSFMPVTVARDEMRRLADEHDLICTAATRVGHEMTFLERAVSRSKLGAAGGYAKRYTIAPPGGSSFIAWAPPPEIDEWIASFAPALGPAGAQAARERLARIRSLGYSYALSNGTGRGDPLTQMALGPGDGDGPLAHIVPPLDPDGDYPVIYVTSPVLGAENELLFTLTLMGFDPVEKGGRISALGEELAITTRRIADVLSPTFR